MRDLDRHIAAFAIGNSVPQLISSEIEVLDVTQLIDETYAQ